MIKNDKELAVAREQVEQITGSNSNLGENEKKQLISPENSESIRDFNDISLLKLQAKIAEYEALVAHNPENPILLEVESAEQISELPIKASIAFKITPQELAEICELEEEQVQFDDSSDTYSDYGSEFFRVMKILGVQLIDDLFFVAKMSNDLKQKLQFLRMGENIDGDFQPTA
jgi:hypothetical protein